MRQTEELKKQRPRPLPAGPWDTRERSRIQRTTTPGGPPKRVAVVVVERIARLRMGAASTRNRGACQKAAKTPWQFAARCRDLAQQHQRCSGVDRYTCDQACDASGIVLAMERDVIRRRVAMGSVRHAKYIMLLICTIK
jgi:hypothetical protein